MGPLRFMAVRFDTHRGPRSLSPSAVHFHIIRLLSLLVKWVLIHGGYAVLALLACPMHLKSQQCTNQHGLHQHIPQYRVNSVRQSGTRPIFSFSNRSWSNKKDSPIMISALLGGLDVGCLWSCIKLTKADSHSLILARLRRNSIKYKKLNKDIMPSMLYYSPVEQQCPKENHE